MKLLDRYIISTFLKNYFIAFFVLVGLYIVLDMVFKFDEIVQVRAAMQREGFEPLLTVAWKLADFYFYQALLFFVHLAGIIAGVAVSFTLLRMTRFNELTAVLAAGTPLLRVAAPIILIAVALGALVVVDQELIIPNVIPKLTRDYGALRGEGAMAYPIPAMQDSQGNLLIAARYYPPVEGAEARLELLDIIERDKNLQPLRHAWADSAQWDAPNGRWALTNGRVVGNLLPDQRPSAPQPVEFYQSNINPEAIALFRSGTFVDLLSIARINQLLQHPESYGARDLLRVKHTRVTQWIMNVILLLLAIPAVLTREPHGMRAAAIKCLGITGLCLGAIALGNNLAGQPPPDLRWAAAWPAVMAWVPVFIFGPVSIWLLDAIKT